jgi:hypothetical protein
MNSHVPDASEVLKDLDPLRPVLFRVFEAALLEAREFFDERNARKDPYLFPHLVRYSVKQYLASRGLEAVECEMEELANSGLSLVYEGYHLRILKSIGGKLPPPGYSLAKQAFWAQQMPFPFAAPVAITPVLNLLILWDVTPQYDLAGLWVACPKSGVTASSVEAYWCVPIPPALPAALPLLDTPEDLPITRKELGRTGTQANG